MSKAKVIKLVSKWRSIRREDINSELQKHRLEHELLKKNKLGRVM